MRVVLADQQFNIRLSADDKKMLGQVARHFQRSQADTIRVLIREVYEVIESKKIADTKPGEVDSDGDFGN